MVPGVGVEPTQCIAPKDFKSFASTNFATRAFNTEAIASRAILQYQWPNSLILPGSFTSPCTNPLGSLVYLHILYASETSRK